MSRHSGNHQSVVVQPRPPSTSSNRDSHGGGGNRNSNNDYSSSNNNSALLAGADRGTMSDIDPHMRTMVDGQIKILYKAKFMDTCADPVNTDLSRIYFYALENGYESNNPFCAILPLKEILACCCIPPSLLCCCWDVQICSNAVCPGDDHITRVYYDRGPYDEHGCLHCSGLVSGKPRTMDRGMRCVCCCQDFPEWILEWWYGEQINVVSYDTCCFCIPNTANYLCNCANLCGPRLGEPLCLNNIAIGLDKGEAAVGTVIIENARKEWEERVRRTQR